MKEILKGAKEKGADTNVVSLNNLDIKGCIGCDACNSSGNGYEKDNY